MLHVMAYLRDHKCSRLVFGPVMLKEGDFFKYDKWGHKYDDAQEEIPPNMPTPLGKPVRFRMYVDSNHAGDKVSQRSRSGFVIYIMGQL